MERQDPVFIQVGALADGFAPEANILASVDALAGRTLALGDASGAWRVYTFEARRTAVARCSDRYGRPRAVSRDAAARQAVLRRLHRFGRPRDIGRLVIDLDNGVWTSVVGALPTEADTRIDAFTRVARAAADGRRGRVPARHARRHTQPGPLHRPTRELIGKRTMYRYSRPNATSTST